MSCSYNIGDFDFEQADIDRVVQQKGLLSMEIEFNSLCNYRCPYCYMGDLVKQRSELTPEEGRSVLQQARDLGARKIIILGGEPMLYPHIFEMIEACRAMDLTLEMFTNGSCIGEDEARRLFDLGVRVVLKKNSFLPDVQDYLVGRKGAFQGMQAALDNLRAAGFPAPGHMLAISTVLCESNADEIVPLWKWAREQGIVPYMEMVTPHKRSRDFKNLRLDPVRAKQIFEELSAWDREHGGHDWDPQPPLVGNRCLRHMFSCLVNACGDVTPCVGVPLRLGNIRETSLRDILNTSEVIEDLRDYKQNIKGPCASCQRIHECYGCRGSAYNETGDYLASDPRCWFNEGKTDQIDYLPVDAARFIPHRDPMRLVDTLLSVGDRVARVATTVRPDMPFVEADGRLGEAAYVEMVAQAAAALDGFRQRGQPGSKLFGMMLGVRHLEITGTARVGDCLEIEIFKTARLGDIGVITGSVSRGAELLAKGEIKVLRGRSTASAGPA